MALAMCMRILSQLRLSIGRPGVEFGFLASRLFVLGQLQVVGSEPLRDPGLSAGFFALHLFVVACVGLCDRSLVFLPGEVTAQTEHFEQTFFNAKSQSPQRIAENEHGRHVTHQ